MSVLIEAAVESLAGAELAVREGAGRLELCADLPRGGTTPGAGLLRSVRSSLDTPLFVMIRPRPGGFLFSPAEHEGMLWDIAEAKRAGADGVVIGVLGPSARIDREWTERLAAAARPMQVTFHRAVDQTPDVAEAIELLVGLGVDRVLTGAGPGSAIEGVETLSVLARRFGSRIGILPGGGVRATNAADIVRATGSRELHVGFPSDAEPGRIALLKDALGEALPAGRHQLS